MNLSCALRRSRWNRQQTGSKAGLFRRLGNVLALIVLVLVLGVPSPSRGQGFDKAVLDRVKDATVYIKLKASGKLISTGSGFAMKVSGDSILIMTNRHVVTTDPGDLPEGVKPEYSVVFRSGTPQQQEVAAMLIAFDFREILDLAVLEVKGVRQLPTPILADATAAESEFFETMQAYALGFPRGGLIVGNANANPAVTVNAMTISSLRRDESGRLTRVQFAGSMIEGNSGGPIVDAKGRLVGVVVERMRGENVGFAIPPSMVADFLSGGAGEVVGAELIGSIGPDTKLRLLLRLVDPLNQVKGFTFRYARQSASAPVETMKPLPGGGYPLLPGGTNVALMVANRQASGTFALPIKTPEDRKILYQFLVTDAAGRVVKSGKPVPATLPDRPGVFAGFETEAKPKALVKWSCETNLGEGIKITHKPGATLIDLPAGVPANNAPQYNLFNAPCALVRVEGDFVAAVQVGDTFDPGGEGVVVPSKKSKLPFSFQSAGLLIWQDEKNFVRLERSKGSDPSNNLAMVNRVLVEVYKNGKEVFHYADVPERPIALAAIRKGGSLQLLFALPPKDLTVFREMPIDFNKEVFVGVAAANLSKRAYQARLERFTLKNLEGEDIEAKPFKMPRLSDSGVVKLPDGTQIFEGAGLKVSTPKDAPVAPQTNMADYKGEWSDNRQLLWSNTKAPQSIVLDLPVDADGKYEIKGKFTLAPDYAIAKLDIDGRPLYKDKELDFYSQEIRPTALISLGTYSLNKGKRKLTITVTRKNPKSSGFRFGLDEIQLVPAK